MHCYIINKPRMILDSVVFTCIIVSCTHIYLLWPTTVLILTTTNWFFLVYSCAQHTDSLWASLPCLFSRSHSLSYWQTYWQWSASSLSSWLCRAPWGIILLITGLIDHLKILKLFTTQWCLLCACMSFRVVHVCVGSGLTSQQNKPSLIQLGAVLYKVLSYLFSAWQLKKINK